ncbi:LamG domain-containing protein [Blastopirellula sp. J2-11]|uniref:LamG domain-containing protein n=1 Tax=Blastopirellula sp. J2-11 TaxID=2943192 RepID=UPI0021C87EC9|nr:LamG domain-containing protein [Blastopirellula sp. J2-11]UUO04620.1 LamG domain-containing protein [Blastopirellula sp. J2-11]
MSYAALQADPDLIGYWKLDEDSSATAADQTATGNDGLNAASSIREAGPNEFVPYSYQFSPGGFSNVRFENPATSFTGGANPRTYAFWAKITSADGSDGLVTLGNELVISVYDLDTESPLLDINFFYHRVRGPAVLEEGEWFHVAIRVPVGATSTSDVEAFINGAEVTLSTSSGSPQELNTTFGTFTRFGLGSGYLTGNLAEFFSFDRALTDEEIMMLVTGGGGGDSAGPRRIHRLGLGGNLGVRR